MTNKGHKCIKKYSCTYKDIYFFLSIFTYSMYVIHIYVLYILLCTLVSILFIFGKNIYTILILFGLGIVILFRILFHIKNIFICIFFFIGIGVFIFLYIDNKITHIESEYIQGFIYSNTKNQTIQGKIIDFPQYKFSYNQYVIQIEGISTYIQIFTKLHQKYKYLDHIEMTGTLKDIRLEDSTWSSLYKRKGIQYLVLYPSAITNSKGYPQNLIEKIKNKLFIFKTYIRSKISERFSSYTSALMLGMLFGEKNELSKEEKDIFNTAQLSHILVVSGYNISLVIVFLFWLLSPFNRAIKLVGSLGAIILFVFLIGYDASVVRAGLMGSLLIIARISHRSGSVINVLCVVVCLMLWNDPYIVFDAGFHLSIIATYSLLIMPKFKRIPEYILSTIWIFLFVSPYILYMTGSISFVGIISNSVVLFVIPFFMMLSLASLILSITSVFIGMDTLLLDIMSRYIFFVAQLVQKAPAFSIALEPALIVFWYVILFGITIFFQNRYTVFEYITKKYQKYQIQKSN
jgi:competence protein ComEC